MNADLLYALADAVDERGGCHRPDCDHGQALAESFGSVLD